MTLLSVCVYYGADTYLCLLSWIPMCIVIYNLYQRQKAAELEDILIHKSLINNILPVNTIMNGSDFLKSSL
jgi:uncharacterized BrkB/YihY/UPF0761 family membrane protein